MITKQTKELLEQLQNTSHGKALQEYLSEKLEEISDITSCQSWEDTLGRKHAVKLIKEIFSMMEPIVTSSRKPGQYR